MAAPPGVSIAPTNGPLDDPVTWSRIDNLPGVHINSISIKRGRSDERSSTEPATVTIEGTDSSGTLDPTNPDGPFAGDLNPVMQSAVSLFNPVSSDWHYLFRGYLDTLTYTPDVSERFATFEITLTDMLDLLNDAEVIPDEAGNAVPQESEGDCYYTGQHADDRILAVLSDSATAFAGKTWPATLLQIASGNVFVQGRVYSRGTSLLQVIDEVCDAEYPGSTNRFITKDGAFAFRGRYYRFVPAFYTAASDADRASGTEMVHWQAGDLAAFEADDTTAVCTALKVADGKTNVINLALVTPLGITDAELASGSNFASDSTSIDDYGPRTSGMSLENLITDDADDGNSALEETASFATATVKNYKDPVAYVSELTFRNPPAAASTERATAVWGILCGLELSDLVTVTATFPGGGGFNPDNGTEQDHYVESISYDLKPLQGDVWDVTQTVELSSRHHFRYIPASWNPPSV